MSRESLATISILFCSKSSSNTGFVFVEVDDDMFLRVTYRWLDILTNMNQWLSILIDGFYGTKIHPTYPMFG